MCGCTCTSACARAESLIWCWHHSAGTRPPKAVMVSLSQSSFLSHFADNPTLESQLWELSWVLWLQLNLEFCSIPTLMDPSWQQDVIIP